MDIIVLKIKDKLDITLCNFLLSLVDEAKRKRLLKFFHERDLYRSLFADLIVRHVLIHDFGLKNEEIRFFTNEFGKPYCKQPNNFHFNVSHSGNWVVCVTSNTQTGIDIEKINHSIDLNIAKNYFSSDEHRNLVMSNSPVDYFFSLWSLKESYIKFLGKGLSQELNSFSITINKYGNISLKRNNQEEKYVYFKQYMIENGYKMSVCSSTPILPDRPLIYTIDKITDTFVNAIN